MANKELDEFDRKILSMLSTNARIAFLEIARECGVSGAAVHQRLQKLLKAGAINGFETLLNPSKLGYETCAFVGFILNGPTDLDKISETLYSIPEVVEVHYTTGKYDILVKIYANNNSHLLKIIHDCQTRMGSGRTETLVSFREELHRPLPVNVKK